MPHAETEPAFGAVFGATVPRTHTPPLVTGPPGPCGCGCALTPETTDGFDVDDFARDVLGRPLDPWQRWLVIHSLELLPDGRPRFRRVLLLVARQNGKTWVCSVLAAFWMTMDDPAFVLGTSTKLAVAKEPWQATINLIKDSDLKDLVPRVGGIRRANDQPELTLTNGSRYQVAAATEDGGRGLPLDRVVCDELRSHHDYSAYGASYFAMRARPFAQFFALSSMGDARSVVLTDMRDAALSFIETGSGDARLGLFEYAPEQGASPDDPAALAQANPNAGRRFDIDDLVNEGRAALAKGGEQLVTFKTEAMNLQVDAMDPAIDPQAWQDCLVVGDLEGLRKGLVMVADVSIDGMHATLVAGAQLPDGRVRIEPVAAWDGPMAVTHMQRDLPGILERNRPRKFGWFPSGPAAAAAATLAERKGRTAWPPRGVVVEEIRGEVSAACMAFAAAVLGRRDVHSGDALLDAQVLAAAKKPLPGDAWRFVRQGDTYVDAVYAAAGVSLLARTLPTPIGNVRIILPRRTSGPDAAS